MSTSSLTELTIKNIHPTGKRVEYRDSKCPGLVMRVTELGAKSWALRYRRVDGIQVRHTIGKYPDINLAAARAEALSLLAKIAKGDDPAYEKKVRRHTAIKDKLTTISAIGTQYFVDAAHGRHRPNGRPKRTSTINLERSYFDRLVIPALGTLSIKSLSRHEIRGTLQNIEAGHGSTAARQCMVVLRQIFSYSVHQSIVDVNPVLSAWVVKSTSRERVFSNDELRLICKALSDSEAVPDLALSQSMAFAISLGMLTLQRAGEVIGMSMKELDLEAKTWTIPGLRTKNRRTHVVPLSDAAMNVIRGAILLNGTMATTDSEDGWDRNVGPLFPSRDMKTPMDRHSMTRAMSRLLKLLKIEDGTLHDLRRTGATNLTSEKIGLSRLVVSQILNHQSDGGGSSPTTGVYDRNQYLADKRHGLQSWAVVVSGLSLQTRP